MNFRNSARYITFSSENRLREIISNKKNTQEKKS